MADCAASSPGAVRRADWAVHRGGREKILISIRIDFCERVPPRRAFARRAFAHRAPCTHRAFARRAFAAPLKDDPKC